MSVADKLECYLFRRQSGSEENPAELEVFVAHRTWLVVFKPPLSVLPLRHFFREKSSSGCYSWIVLSLCWSYWLLPQISIVFQYSAKGYKFIQLAEKWLPQQSARHLGLTLPLVAFGSLNLLRSVDAGALCVVQYRYSGTYHERLIAASHQTPLANKRLSENGTSWARVHVQTGSEVIRRRRGGVKQLLKSLCSKFDFSIQAGERKECH